MSNGNKKKEPQNRAKDYVTNKLLCVFTLAFIMIIALMNVNNMMRRTDTFVAVFHSIGTVAWCMLGVTLLFTVIAIVRHVHRKDDRYRLLSAKNLAVVLGFITLCTGALALAFNETTLRLLYIFIPAVTILYIIFYSYARDFFVLATVSGFGAIGLWMMGTALSGGAGASRLWLIIGLMLAAIAIITVLTIVIQANGGALFRSGKFRVCTGGAHYALLYSTYAALLALTALTWFLAGAMMYYFVIALLVWLVAVGIYYTLKAL